MLKIGLTGGIGSGKSTVARIFEQLQVPVYYADEESKKLLNSDPEIILYLKETYGEDIYTDGKVDRARLANVVFNNQEALAQLNAVVHPAVAKNFDSWISGKKVAYIMKEAAILFEVGSYKTLDKNILVIAPEALRIKRVKERDHTSEEEIKARIDKQWKDEKKQLLADFVIYNDESRSLIKQILAIHEDIISHTNEGSR